MVLAKNTLSLAASVLLGLALVGCKTDMSAVSNAEEGLKASSADLSSSLSLTPPPYGDGAPVNQCRTAKKISQVINTGHATAAVFKTLNTALHVPAGISMQHISNAEDATNYVAVSKKSFYGNVALKKQDGKSTQLSSLIMEGSCEDYQLTKDNFTNLVSVESKECGKAATLLVTGSGAVGSAIYFNDGYVYLRYNGETGGANFQHRWYQYADSKTEEIKTDIKSEIVCVKFGVQAKKTMDSVQHQYFGQYK